eukprot:scaffold9591_cov98-Isochrysis_galbana.AAC.4
MNGMHALATPRHLHARGCGQSWRQGQQCPYFSGSGGGELVVVVPTQAAGSRGAMEFLRQPPLRLRLAHAMDSCAREQHEAQGVSTACCQPVQQCRRPSELRTRSPASPPGCTAQT